MAAKRNLKLAISPVVARSVYPRSVYVATGCGWVEN